MTTLNVSLSDSLLQFVNQRAAEAGFQSADEYMQDLVAQDQRRSELEKSLIESLDSGPPVVIDQQWWEEKRQHVLNMRAEGTGE